MKKELRTLKKQIKELERLVELKEAVIEELKTLIRPQFSPFVTTTSDTVFLNADGTADITTISNDVPYTLTAVDKA